MLVVFLREAHERVDSSVEAFMMPKNCCEQLASIHWARELQKADWYSLEFSNMTEPQNQ